MMQDMMKECCTADGKPDFDKMKRFMQGCGKQGFSEDEIAMMKRFCGGEGMPDPAKMEQLMKRCGCRTD
ncbi:MAG TPA: hypothetical protein VLS27_16605 [Gammaproteobacteria bacterium]|nr:hypothetical protein [Gammaproteobacteria bacterium]